MSRRAILSRACAAILLAVVAPPASPADRAAAEAAHARGRSALKARQWQEAVVAFGEALVEDPAYLPARSGLGQALLGLGERGAGLEALRALLDVADRDEGAAAAWSREVGEARGLLTSKDTEGMRLRRAIDDHVAALTRISKRAADGDPDLAIVAALEASALRPRQADLAALRAALGADALGEPLFNGEDGRGWSWFDAPSWTVESRAIIGKAADVYATTRSQVRLSGDFDVRVQVRVLEGGRSAVFLLQGGWSDFASNISVGMRGEDVLFADGRLLGGTADPPSVPGHKTRRRIDPAHWTLFELRFRTDRVAALAGGEEFSSMVLPPGRSEGHVALRVLAGRVAFRRLEVVRR